MGNPGCDNLLDGLFPEEVVTEAGNPGDMEGDIYPEEQACVRNAVPKRKREFAAGRICARRALTRLGVAGSPLLVGRNGTPIWPPGTVGSISHCESYCGVAVAWETHMRGVGLDVEYVDRVHEQLWRHICTPQELTWVKSLPRGQRRQGAALIFSAKESAYKCQYPVTRRWLDYTDATIRIEPRQHEFEARFAVPEHVACPRQLRGRFVIRGNYVLTATILENQTKAIHQ